MRLTKESVERGHVCRMDKYPIETMVVRDTWRGQ